MKNEKFSKPPSVGPKELSLKSLRIFMTVEESGSMSAAAERLKASLSGVSQHISALERDIGGEIFDRSVKPIALTAVGHVLKKHAVRILDASSAARAELFELQLSLPSQLRFGVIGDLDATVTPALAAHVTEKFPGCVFSACSGRSDYMTRRLLERKADVIVTADPPPQINDYESFPLLREPFVLCAAKGVLDPDEDIRRQLENLPFIRFDPQMPIGISVSQHLRRVNLVPPMQYSFDATRSILATVRDQKGWAMVTPLCMLDSIRFKDSLDVLPLPFSGLTRSVYLVSRRDELGKLPQQLAQMCSGLIRDHLLPELSEMFPWLEHRFEIFDDFDAG